VTGQQLHDPGGRAWLDQVRLRARAFRGADKSTGPLPVCPLSRLRERVGVRACFSLLKSKSALIRPPGTFSREAGEGKTKKAAPKGRPSSRFLVGETGFEPATSTSRT